MIEPMGSLDAVFLAIEDARNPMNIGSVGIFRGQTPLLDHALEYLGGRLSTIARCRQRVAMPRRIVGRPLWVTDDRFDIRHHVHRLHLADTEFESFEDLVAGMVAIPLDRHRPLWEMWIVDGVADDRWAIVSKVHHCMADGIAGTDLLSALFVDDGDSDSVISAVETSPPESLNGASLSKPSLFRYRVERTARTVITRVGGALDVLTHPRRSSRRALRIASAARRLWLAPRHPPTSLVGEIGIGRRWVNLSVPMDHATTIRASLGGTLNDVVLAAISIGFRNLLVERGESIEGRTITAMVPVSLRPTADRGAAGNRVANVHAPLPVGIVDARAVLRQVRTTLDDLKRSHETEATGLLMRIGDYVPRVVADRVARTVFHHQRDVETVVTNVPGPQDVLWFGPHEMVEGYPVAPIGGRVRITVAVWSYGNKLAFGITGDRDTTGDLDHLGRELARGFEELLSASGGGHQSTNVD